MARGEVFCQHCRRPMKLVRETDDFWLFRCTLCSPWGMERVVSRPKNRAKAKAEADIERRLRQEEEQRRREAKPIIFT